METEKSQYVQVVRVLVGVDQVTKSPIILMLDGVSVKEFNEQSVNELVNHINSIDDSIRFLFVDDITPYTKQQIINKLTLPGSRYTITRETAIALIAATGYNTPDEDRMIPYIIRDLIVTKRPSLQRELISVEVGEPQPSLYEIRFGDTEWGIFQDGISRTSYEIGERSSK